MIEDTSGNPRFSEEQKEEWESVWLDLENPDPLEKRDLVSLLSLRFLEPTIEATDITQYDPERPETRFFAYSPSEVIHRKIQQQRKRQSRTVYEKRNKHGRQESEDGSADDESEDVRSRSSKKRSSTTEVESDFENVFSKGSLWAFKGPKTHTGDQTARIGKFIRDTKATTIEAMKRVEGRRNQWAVVKGSVYHPKKESIRGPIIMNANNRMDKEMIGRICIWMRCTPKNIL